VVIRQRWAFVVMWRTIAPSLRMRNDFLRGEREAVLLSRIEGDGHYLSRLLLGVLDVPGAPVEV